MGTTIRSQYQKFGYKNLITVEGISIYWGKHKKELLCCRIKCVFLKKHKKENKDKLSHLLCW